MPTNECARDALCPFFRSASAKGGLDWACKVGCEGVTDESVLCVRFRTAREYARYRDARCDAQYRLCPVYVGLMRAKYGGEQ